MKINPELRFVMTIGKWILIAIGVVMAWATVIVFGLLIGA